jgi:hypothetical protein
MFASTRPMEKVMDMGADCDGPDNPSCRLRQQRSRAMLHTAHRAAYGIELRTARCQAAALRNVGVDSLRKTASRADYLHGKTPLGALHGTCQAHVIG